MCLIGLALDCDRRFPLVIAANRDEFFDRPAARLAWWTPAPGLPPVLSGRDLEGGGTWLGLTAEGRLAMLTNVRNPGAQDDSAPTRGRVVTDWLAAREPADRFWMRTALSGHNGFNLVAADFRRGECFWASNTQPYPMRLEKGIYGVSNAILDTGWPKVKALKVRMRAALADVESVDVLAARLFDALGDRSEAPDAELPETGVPLAVERQLSAAHIRATERGYGTRCATLVITERVRRAMVTHVFERSFSATGGVALLRRATLKHWPPRYTEDGRAAASEAGQVSESELSVPGHHATAEAAGAPPRRTRVRSLLKPDKPAGKRS